MELKVGHGPPNMLCIKDNDYYIDASTPNNIVWYCRLFLGISIVQVAKLWNKKE